MSAAHREQIRQRLTELVGCKVTLQIAGAIGGAHWHKCAVKRPPSEYGYLVPDDGGWCLNDGGPGYEVAYRVPLRRRRERTTRWVPVADILEVEAGW